MCGLVLEVSLCEWFLHWMLCFLSSTIYQLPYGCVYACDLTMQEKHVPTDSTATDTCDKCICFKRSYTKVSTLTLLPFCFSVPSPFRCLKQPHTLNAVKSYQSTYTKPMKSVLWLLVTISFEAMLVDKM